MILKRFQSALILSLSGLTAPLCLNACSGDRPAPILIAQSSRADAGSNPAENIYISAEANDSIDAESPVAPPVDAADPSPSVAAEGPSEEETKPNASADLPIASPSPAPSANPGAPLPIPPATPVASSPNSPISVIANGHYLLQSVQSHRCMDVPSGKSDNEWQLQIFDCSNTNPNQLMTIEFIEQNYYRLVTANKKNLEGKKEDLKAGSPFIQNLPTGLVNQQFSFEATGIDSIYVVKLRGQDLVIEVANGRTANNSLLQLARNKASDHQKWLLIRIP